MTSTTDIIHLGSSSCPRLSSLLYKGIDLAWISDSPFRQTLYEYTSLFIFPYVKVLSIFSQQIGNDFIVNLEIACSDHESSLILSIQIYLFVTRILYKLKNLFNRAGNDTSLRIMTIVFKSFHCKSLPCASLTVSHNGCVEAF